MRIIPRTAPILVVAAILAGASSSAHGQTSGAHTGAHADTPANAADGSAVPSSPRASGDSALLTGALGSRSPSGVVVVAGTTVRLTWSGDEPGATRAWAVHRGTCSRDLGMLGAAGAYPSFRADARGNGTAEAVLPAPLGGNDTYFVAVHAGSEAGSSTPVACGPIKGAATPDAPASGHDGMSHDAMNHGAPSSTPTSGVPAGGSAGAATDHAAMGHGTATAAPTAAPTADPMADDGAMMDMHMRMMADSVIRQRIMADTAMHRMMMASVQRMPAEHRDHMQAMMHGSGSGSGAASASPMPVRKDARMDAARPAVRGTATRPTTTRPAVARPSAVRQPAARPANRAPAADPHAGHGAAPAARPAAPARTSTPPRPAADPHAGHGAAPTARSTAPARTPAPARPATRPAARPAPRDSMAGMDHSKHQMPRR